MPKHVVIEELHVTILVRADLPAKTVAKVRRVLGGRPFAKRLAHEAAGACRILTAPGAVKVRVSK
ncbi:MAG: hypothetical protein WCL32_25190 [Planctomycetota bacterium]